VGEKRPKFGDAVYSFQRKADGKQPNGEVTHVERDWSTDSADVHVRWYGATPKQTSDTEIIDMERFLYHHDERSDQWQLPED
jgi:hypothetical protein